MSQGPSLPPTVLLPGASRAPRRRRWLLVLGGIVALVVALALAAGIILLVDRGHLPGGTKIGGVDVGGLTHQEARLALRDATRDPRRRMIELRGDAGLETTTGLEIGARPRLSDALDEADSVGALDRLKARVGLGSGRSVPLSYDLSRRRVAVLAQGLQVVFGIPAQDAMVIVDEAELTVTPAEEGVVVERAKLVDALQSLPAVVQVPLKRVNAAVSTREAERAASDAAELLSGPRYVGRGTTTVELRPAKLRRMLEFVSHRGRIELSLQSELLRRALSPLRSLERKPRDATWSTDGKRATVVPSRDGRTIDPARTATTIVARPETTTHNARFSAVAPTFTTEQAERLRITELVSEFTTYHPCCAPRVTNIHRAAEILDGRIIEPRGRFSLNKELGKRTPERGFVMAPQILAGRLTDAVGGGVSQIATTLFNAAFFAGLQLDVHQPHEFYISRYPMGREATVSWGGPELIFTNTWAAAVLVRMKVTDTSITVRFFSSKLGRRVKTVTREPCCYVQPRTFVTTNKALAPGKRRVLQGAGPAGFTVSYTRKVFKGDRLVQNEKYVVRYKAENAFVEQGPPKKGKKGKKGADPGAAPPTAGTPEAPVTEGAPEATPPEPATPADVPPEPAGSNAVDQPAIGG